MELDYKTQVRESCSALRADSLFCLWAKKCLYFSLKIPCFDQLQLPAGNGCSTSHIRATSFCFPGCSSCSAWLCLLLSLCTYLLGLFAGGACSWRQNSLTMKVAMHRWRPQTMQWREHTAVLKYREAALCEGAEKSLGMGTELSNPAPHV